MGCGRPCAFNPKVKTTRLLLLSAIISGAALAADPLPSWNDTAPKKAITAFVEKVTKSGSPDFVPAAERIATFDIGSDLDSSVSLDYFDQALLRLQRHHLHDDDQVSEEV